MTAPFQPSLLDFRPPESSPRAAPQDRQAARVGRGIDEEVMAVARVLIGLEFTLDVFTHAVQGRLAGRDKRCAPDSARRRLSALVKAGFVDAECTDRSRSLWIVKAVRG